MTRRWLGLSLVAGCLGTTAWACGGGTAASGPPPGSGASDAGNGSPGSSGSSSGGSNDDAGVDAAPTSFPIKHVVVIVKENHTFDNYFGTFPGAEGNTSCTMSDGGVIPCPHAPDVTSHDLCHAHSCALTDWNGGAMNGWDLSGGSNMGDTLAYSQYVEADIPNYWAYARTFTLADHFFANVLGPSFPGHTFVLAAQVGWATDNPSGVGLLWGCDQLGTTVPVLDDGGPDASSVAPCFNIPSVPTVLPAGVDWKFYGTNLYGVENEPWSMFDAIQPIRETSAWTNNVVLASTFDSDVAAGTLPAVSWLVDQDADDEHPGLPAGFGSVCQGEGWTVGHINAIMQSPLWASTAILFTMDDFGGWYDHVAPTRQYGGDAQHPYGDGFRLPLIVISPYARPAYVFKEQAEQASIPRFIETVFGSKTLLHDLDPAAQDSVANTLLDAFDFNQTPLPPLVLTPRDCSAPADAGADGSSDAGAPIDASAD